MQVSENNSQIYADVGGKSGGLAFWGKMACLLCHFIFLRVLDSIVFLKRFGHGGPIWGADGRTRSIFSVEIPIEHYVINIRG